MYVRNVIYDVPIVNIILNGGKLRIFPLSSRTRQDAHSYPIVLEALVIAVRREKGRSETVCSCRRHDVVFRKPYTLHQKTIKTNKCSQ